MGHLLEMLAPPNLEVTHGWPKSYRPLVGWVLFNPFIQVQIKGMTAVRFPQTGFLQIIVESPCNFIRFKLHPFNNIDDNIIGVMAS